MKLDVIKVKWTEYTEMLRLVWSTGFTDITFKTGRKDDGSTVDPDSKPALNAAYQAQNDTVFVSVSSEVIFPQIPHYAYALTEAFNRVNKFVYVS